MKEYGSDQYISARTIERDTANENETLKTLELLESTDSLTVQNQETEEEQSLFEFSLSTSGYDNSGFEHSNSADDHLDFQRDLDKLAKVKDTQGKRDFLKYIIAKEQRDIHQVSLVEGSTFNQETTYNGLALNLNSDYLWQTNEGHVVRQAENRYLFEKRIKEQYEDTKQQKVYRGNPDLWTPLGEDLPESQKLKIKEEMASYTEPNHYELIFQTKKRRPAEQVSQQKDYLDMPRMTQYYEE